MGEGLGQNPTETTRGKGVKAGTARSEPKLAASPEGPPWGRDRKVPPQWGARPGEELARENSGRATPGHRRAP